MSPSRCVLTPRGDFSLAEAIRFVHGFEPLSPGDAGRDPGDTLRLAFCADGDWRPVGLSARQAFDGGRVTVTTSGSGDRAVVRRQVERILSLDVDGSSLGDAVGGDGVAASLVEDFAGLRPVCFASPYEAACWAVISQRIQMTQAARVRRRMCAELGEVVDVDGVDLTVFPAPDRLVTAATIPGLPVFKVERLRGIAQAALDGRLDATALRAAGPEQALTELQALPGIGPFGAELVLIRGAGEPDWFARSERRLHAAMANAYGIELGDLDALEVIAAGWRPFRSWIAFLFRARAAAAVAAA